VANGNGNGKLTGVLISGLLVVLMTLVGYISGRVAEANEAIETLQLRHHDDQEVMRERMGTTEAYQREVLRRLDRIEAKLGT